MEELDESLATDIEEPVTRYPLLVKRIQSVFIDALLLLAVTAIIATVISQIGEVPDWTRATMFITLWFLYEPICITFGGTAGNYLRKIRVRRTEDESRRINLPQAFIRFFIKGILGWVSFFTIHTNRQKRAIHDLVSGSVMIEV